MQVQAPDDAAYKLNSIDFAIYLRLEHVAVCGARPEGLQKFNIVGSEVIRESFQLRAFAVGQRLEMRHRGGV